jgi:hypothetical protein
MFHAEYFTSKQNRIRRIQRFKRTHVWSKYSVEREIGACKYGRTEANVLLLTWGSLQINCAEIIKLLISCIKHLYL